VAQRSQDPGYGQITLDLSLSQRKVCDTCDDYCLKACRPGSTSAYCTRALATTTRKQMLNKKLMSFIRWIPLSRLPQKRVNNRCVLVIELAPQFACRFIASCSLEQLSSYKPLFPGRYLCQSVGKCLAAPETSFISSCSPERSSPKNL